MGSKGKGGGKGGGRRKRGKGAGNRSTPKRSPQGNNAGDTSPGSTASPSGKSPATNRRKVDDAADPSTMEVEALDDGTEAVAAKAAEEAAQRLEAESQNVTPDETEKIAKAKEPTPPTDQEEQDGQDRADSEEETPRSPPQRQKSFAKAAAFSDSDSNDNEVLDLTDILKPSERQEQAKKTAKKHREREAKIAEAKKLAEEKERKKTASMKAAKAKESATRDLAKQLDAAVDPPGTPKKHVGGSTNEVSSGFGYCVFGDHRYPSAPLVDSQILTLRGLSQATRFPRAKMMP